MAEEKATVPTRLGHGLAKVLGIQLQEPELIREDLPGESDHIFYEQQPTTGEFLHNLIPTGQDVLNFLTSLFPFLSWIGHYNLQWLLGDLVAGITIGAVIVPQSMAYAKLATLDVQFGLYSSFMGGALYWFFATSKDISIGPVAVLSTITGKVVTALSKEFPDTPPHVIASGYGVISGAVVLALGVFRCGWIIDLIPIVALSAFVTGSAITIATIQIPTLLGLHGVSTKEAPYEVFIEIIRHLGRAHGPDAAVGVSSLVLLYLIRYACTAIGKRWAQHQRVAFFFSTLRAVFVILLYTMISWLVNMSHKEQPSFGILMTVPRGFQDAAVPNISPELASSYVSELPAAVIVLVLEHVAVAKSFGRVNNYRINPSQEMVAVGVSNILGAFLGAFPNTGSFSRTAIQSKAGARTPATGIVTALVVLLAIYALPPVFYYIPNATLAAVVIHAIGDLVTSPNTVYQFWRVSPIDFFIFFLGVFVSVFTNIESGIYASVGASIAILLFRFLKARGDILGRIRVHSIMDDKVIGDDHRQLLGNFRSFSTSDLSLAPVASTSAPTRNIFLPVSHRDGSNPEVDVENPYTGIFIYRFSEGFNFPNAGHTLEHLAAHIMDHTRRNNADQYVAPGDRPWNDPGPIKGSTPSRRDLPNLKAVILDFSSVNNVDVTAVQQLIDLRNQLDRHAAPDVVDWHMACIYNRWTKRALVAAGFGHPTQRPGPDGLSHRWQNVFSVTEIEGGSGAALRDGEVMDQNASAARAREADAEKAPRMVPRKGASGGAGGSEKMEVETVEEVRPALSRLNSRKVAIHGLNRPLFHVDLTSALQSAIANVEAVRAVHVAPRPSPVR